MTHPALRAALPAVLISLSMATQAFAILTRSDIDSAADAVASRRCGAVCKILPDGEGVLIAPSWVLTAAHVATGAAPNRLRARFAGVDYRVSRVIPYPDWKPGASDMALMQLSSPVRGVEPLRLHDAPLSVGQPVWIAGRGDFGDARRGVVGNDGKLRIANNALWELEANRLLIRLDEPGAGALSAEGISGPGDSGTPLLIERDGRLEVIGVGSVGSPPQGGRYGDYGSVDVFVRTSHFSEWIGRRGAEEH